MWLFFSEIEILQPRYKALVIMSILSDLKEYFEIDDGYLPEIVFQGYMESEIIRVYNALTLISDRSSLDSVLWHLPTESEIKLSQFPCAATMIMSGEAEPFRMLFVKMTSICQRTFCQLTQKQEQKGFWGVSGTP